MAKKKDDGTAWGIILVALGTIFLLQSVFDIEIFREIWKFWPVILIVWGLKVLKDSRTS
jgi:uncharacterized membrane protein (UPF0136 family)